MRDCRNCVACRFDEVRRNMYGWICEAGEDGVFVITDFKIATDCGMYEHNGKEINDQYCESCGNDHTFCECDRMRR